MPLSSHRPSTLPVLGDSALKAIVDKSPPRLIVDLGRVALRPEDVVEGLGLTPHQQQAVIGKLGRWRELRSVEASREITADLLGLLPELDDVYRRQEIKRRVAQLMWRDDRTRPGELRKQASPHLTIGRFRKSTDDLELVFILEKGAGHKYLKRVPRANPPPKYRYIYQHPKRKGLTSSEDLQAGAKLKAEHQGQEGHFEVKAHDKQKGIVTLKHDESGKTAHVREEDLHRMVQAYHAKRGAAAKPERKRKKKAKTKPLKLVVQPTQQRLPGTEKKPEPEKPKGKTKPIPLAKQEDIASYHEVVGFVPDKQAADDLAKALGAGREYAAIQQPRGFVVVARSGGGKPGEGDETQLYMRDRGGKGISKIDAQYVLMEADKLIPSNDPVAGFKVRGDYPKDVQERRYEDLPGEQLKVQRIARRLEPGLLANTNPDAVNGTPIVTPNGVVLGGNGRTMAMQLAYHQEPESAKAYQDYLARNARQFGVSADDVRGMKRPVLVRRIEHVEGTDEMRKLGRRMNEALTQGLDPRSAEVALGKNFVTPHLTDVLVAQMEPDESLDDYLLSPRSKDFVAALERAGIIDALNRDEFVERGLLNEDGRLRVERVLAARFIPDAKLLSEMGQKLRGNLAKSTPHLLRAEAAGWDIREPLAAAIRADNEIRTNTKIADRKQLLAQEVNETVAPDHPALGVQKDPMAAIMLTVIQDYNRERSRGGKPSMQSGFREFARRAEASQHAATGFAMFADEAEKPTQALDRAFGISDEAKSEIKAEAAAKRRRDIERQVTEEAGELFASYWDTWEKAEVNPPKVQDERLGTYVIDAVVREINHYVRAHRTLAGLKNKSKLDISKSKIKAHVNEFLLYAMTHDANMARAVGAHPVDGKTLGGLIDAALQVHEGELSKALAGPFIGPRGGKWADAAHTIPWQEPGQGGGLRQLMEEAIRAHGQQAVQQALQSALKGSAAAIDGKLQRAAAVVATDPDVKRAGVEIAGRVTSQPTGQRAVQLAHELAGTPAVRKAGKQKLEEINDQVVDAVVEKVAVGRLAKAKAILGATLKAMARPFVFGFVDNFMLYVAGHSIDNAIQARGFSTAATAGIGNAISDAVGEMAGGGLDRVLDRFGLSDEAISGVLSEKAQNRIKAVAGPLGVFLGCIAGMVPLAFGVRFGKATEDDLQKGGPYIGPRGGKWADPAHTIPWKEPALPKVKVDDVSKLYRKLLSLGFVPALKHLPKSTKEHYQEHGQYTAERRKLHDKIKAEYLAKGDPVGEHEKPVAVLTMGGPGSGKSSATQGMSFDGFVPVDPDAVKASIPEYREACDGKALNAALMSHAESSDIASAIRDEAIATRRNVLIDGTGKDLGKMTKIVMHLAAKGYHVRVIMPHLPMDEGKARVAARAEQTGRFVPDDVVEEAYRKIPYNFTKIAEAADEALLVATDVPLGQPAPVVWTKGPGGEAIHDHGRYMEFQRHAQPY